jgi:hypothetical protein
MTVAIRPWVKAEFFVVTKHVPLSTVNPSQISPVVPQKRRKGSIENAFNVEDSNHLRESIARMFYSGG